MSEATEAARATIDHIPEAEIAAENAGAAAVAEAATMREHSAADMAKAAQRSAAAATAGTAPVQPLHESANEHARINAGVLKKAEQELAHYLPGKLDAGFMPELTLSLTPSVKQGKASLHMHFTGPEAQADPLAFKTSLQKVLAHHPAFAHVLVQPAHKLDAHSSADGGVDITVPDLNEHQYQALVNALAATPAASVVPLVELPHIEHKPQAAVEHKPTAVHASALADSPAVITAPKIGGGDTGIQAPKIGFDAVGASASAPHHGDNHVAPSSVLANDNEAQHHGTVGSHAVAASRA